MSDYGRGRTLMLGSYVSAAYQSTPSADTARFYRALLDWAGVSRPVSVTGAPVEIRMLDAGDSSLVVAFNHDRAMPARAVMTLRSSRVRPTATDLISGALVSLDVAQQHITVPLEIPASDVRVLRITGR